MSMKIHRSYSSTDTTTDRRITEMMRHETPAPPPDGWFVNKVMNRLPARRQRIVRLPEVAAWLVVTAVSVYITIGELKEGMSLPDPTSYNPAVMIGAIAMAIGATLFLSVPILRRCLH